MNYLIGIDNGGTATKAAVFSLDGGQVSAATRPVRIMEPHPGWSERDTNEMWRATAEVVREAICRAGIQPSEVAGVACTGHGNGLYLIDDAGEPVRPGINSSDTRAQAIVQRWRETGIEHEAMRYTAQQLWAGQPPPLLAWLQEHEPATYSRTRWILLAKDFTRYKLTGSIHAELTDYSGANLMDVSQSKFSGDLLRLYKLAGVESRLPPVIASHQVAGYVSPTSAAETGLMAGTPVAGGMFDIDACCLASGVMDTSRMAIVAGTWGNCLSVSPTLVNDPRIFMTSCFAVPGQYLLLEGSPTSAANLDWALRELGLESYAQAEEAACSAGPRVPFFLPFLYGSNAGFNAQACFLGLHASTTKAELLRAMYEGVCFAQRVHYERLLQFGGVPESVRLSGGAARSTFWCRLFSDTLGVPVEVPDGEELGAKGAALAAGIAAGCFRDFEHAVQCMTRVARRYVPEHSMDERFRTYQEIIAQMQGVWPLLPV